MFQLHRIAAVVAIGLVAAAPAWGGSSSQDHPATSRFPAPSALERALQAKDSHPATSVFTAPYALERALQSDGEDALGRALRIGAASLPQPTADVGSAAATGGERLIRWPQVGIGVGVGLLLAFGAVVLVRFARSRPLPS
jgi:hypothetical protein